MKLSTIAVIVAGIVGAVATAVCIHGRDTTDVEVTETADVPVETPTEPAAETTAEA